LTEWLCSHVVFTWFKDYAIEIAVEITEKGIWSNILHPWLFRNWSSKAKPYALYMADCFGTNINENSIILT
jgi:hypothetical protein